MKKKSYALLITSLAVISLGACSNASNTSNKTVSKTVASSSSTTVESSTETEFSSITEATTESGNSQTFKLMIEAAQSQVPALKTQAGEMYSDIKIEEGEDSTIIYSYTFAQKAEVAVDQEALKPTMVKAMKPVIDGAKGMIPDVKIQIIYLNPDSSEIANMTITQEDTDKIE
ncbi:hypothetical protein I6N95_22720 [Vagococcus sp. BWB3-3]|uniref:Lipoprotein n=1 Tax=Vagococcus allomyrinae TaxID=2794353 RepID=A0A940PFV5_9ENTE|nr:hypothetical protein [Vagococcus allomyrinae]MBP1043847.1 hypothetical protein [Vagococcus allomyrinae]